MSNSRKSSLLRICRIRGDVVQDYVAFVISRTLGNVGLDCVVLGCVVLDCVVLDCVVLDPVGVPHEHVFKVQFLKIRL